MKVTGITSVGNSGKSVVKEKPPCKTEKIKQITIVWTENRQIRMNPTENE
jgi:hypothetical protein